MVLKLLALAGAAAAACTTDESCSLNGVCDGGTCVCDPEWTGAACERLNLAAPSAVTAAFPPPSLRANTTSWGATVLRDPSPNATAQYHMYAAVMANGCGMTTWATNSLIQHAVADAPDGPFAPREVLMPPFAHNPTAVRAPDGTYLIYHIGCGKRRDGAVPCTDCAGGRSGATCKGVAEEVACDGASTNILHAQSPDGPWARLNAPIVKSPTMGSPYQVDNPTVTFFPNGSLLMLGRGGNPAAMATSDGVITAPSWRGPYTMHTMIGNGTINIEDPFVWQDRRGNLHALFHKFTDEHPNSGGHAFARASAAGAGGAGWTVSAAAAYTTAITTADGAVTTFNRRERPHLLLDAATGRVPLMLYTTLTQWSSSGANKGHDDAFTHGQWLVKPGYEGDDAAVVEHGVK